MNFPQNNISQSRLDIVHMLAAANSCLVMPVRLIVTSKALVGKEARYSLRLHNYSKSHITVKSGSVSIILREEKARILKNHF